MTPEEIIDLLTTVAAHDQRTVGEADVEAWLDVATEAGWTYPLARRAIRDYHVRGGDKPRIRPAHITDAIEAARETVRRTVLRSDLTPPRELADDPRAEIAWRREYVRTATEAALAAWAEGRPMPAAPELPASPRSDAQPVIERFADRFVLHAPRRGEPVDANDRRRRIEAARAELPPPAPMPSADQL
jgi:hypothetical protein